MRQFLITTSCGKRLIGKAVAAYPAVSQALVSGTIVIVAGTTNGYVAEELLGQIGEVDHFDRSRFFRGLVLPPSKPTTDTGRSPDENKFPGDVVITNGVWRKGQTIFDVVDDLKEGDVIIKGANALDPVRKRAAVLIGHPKAGTIGVALQACIGRRVRLILPVGLEKRVFSNLDELCAKLNQPGAKGFRLLPTPGEVITEIEAIKLITGADATLFAAGGVSGAEGGIWLIISGAPEQLEVCENLLKTISREPAFSM